MSATKADLGVVAYFGGTSYDTNIHAGSDHKKEWLSRTLECLKNVCERVLVGVCLPADKHFAEGLVGAENVHMFDRQYMDPLDLPMRTIQYARNMARYNLKMPPQSTIFYAEADQEFRFNKSSLASHLHTVENSVDPLTFQRDKFVIPWTWEDTMREDGADWTCRHGLYIGVIDGKVMQNTNASYEYPKHVEENKVRIAPPTYSPYYIVPPVIDTRQGAPHKHTPESRCEGFGGSFIASLDLLSRVNFQERRPDPLEAVNFCIFETGVCLKTIDPFDFVRIHFGGGKDHISRCNCQVPITPDDPRWLKEQA